MEEATTNHAGFLWPFFRRRARKALCRRWVRMEMCSSEGEVWPCHVTSQLLERFGGTLSISSFEEIDELANYHDSSQIHMQWICPSWKTNIDTKNPHNWKENPLRNPYFWDPAASFPGCRPLDMFFQSSYGFNDTSTCVSTRTCDKSLYIPAWQLLVSFGADLALQ